MHWSYALPRFFQMARRVDSLTICHGVTHADSHAPSHSGAQLPLHTALDSGFPLRHDRHGQRATADRFARQLPRWGTTKKESGTFDPLKPSNPDGQSYHGDHVYAFNQKPVNARTLPIVMWHGAEPVFKSWETTADGREGFQNLFLRRRFATYLIDQPRRGKAGRSMVEATLKPVADDQMWFNQFRIGLWPNYFAGSQFPKGRPRLTSSSVRSRPTPAPSTSV